MPPIVKSQEKSHFSRRRLLQPSTNRAFSVHLQRLSAYNGRIYESESFRAHFPGGWGSLLVMGLGVTGRNDGLDVEAKEQLWARSLSQYW
jgi:hypothetical protein